MTPRVITWLLWVSAAVCLLVIAALFAANPASAHSWYPRECCSEQDCEPVPIDGVEEVSGGYRVTYKSQVWNVDAKLLFPRGLVKPSQDGSYHACWRPCPGCKDGVQLFCFFIPYNI